MFRNSFFGVLLVLLFMLAVSSAGTIHVPGDYSTIQAGLDAAQTADTVLVAPGTYFENLNWPNTQSIKLIGEMGPSLTVIDGDSLGRVITIESSVDSSTVITGFTVRNGYGPFGAGILSWGASPRIISNIFTSNHTDGSGSGGGVYFVQTTCVIVEGNQFLYNSAGSSLMGSGGGGLCVYFNNPAEHVVISGNTFIGNTCPYTSSASFGGGMWLGWGSGAPMDISLNEFIGNSAGMGGGMCLSGNNSIVTNCDFEGNTSWTGGGVAIWNGLPTISQCSITGNTGEAGGVFVGNYGDLTMDSCTVANNTGDGISAYSGSCLVNYCNILGNTGYGVYADGCSIDATYCWWGDPSGPGGVGPGTGDEVSANVLYDPWLTELGIEEGIPPVDLGLSMAPNPFSASSTISFENPSSGSVVLQVFDLSGRLVETLVEDDLQEGFHSVAFNTDGYCPGLYLIRLQTGSTVQTERCVLLR